MKGRRTEAAIGQDAHLWDVQHGNTKAAESYFFICGIPVICGVPIAHSCTMLLVLVHCRSLGRCQRDKGMRSNNATTHSMIPIQKGKRPRRQSSDDGMQIVRFVVSR